MKKIKVGINGFGRIGRAIFRNNLEKKQFEVVAINEINPDIDNIAYTLNFDTLYDRLTNAFKTNGKYIITPDDEKIFVSHEKDINKVNWAEYDVDFIIDSSGVLHNVFLSHELVKSKVVKKVFITHSPEPVDFTMVLGANEDELDVDKHHVISTSICDATAIAPVLKIISKSIGISNGYVTTLHPWLNYQNLMDGPASSWSVPGEIYHHYALGRSVIGNMIPKPTSAIEATCKVLEREGITESMIGSFSYRTPTAIIGSADITINLKNEITLSEMTNIFEKFELNQNWKIIHNNWEPLVSLDWKKSEYSAIIDHRWTNIIEKKLLKLVIWYDNEWGYASKVLDQIAFVSKKIIG